MLLNYNLLLSAASFRGLASLLHHVCSRSCTLTAQTENPQENHTYEKSTYEKE